MRQLGVGHLVSLGVLSTCLVVGLPSCQLVVNAQAQQCKTDGDCEQLGPAFAGATCSAEGMCQTKAAKACHTNSECIDAAGGKPAICRKSDFTCRELLTADCESVVPENALTNDNTVLVGFMGALRGDYSTIGVPTNRGFELALREIQTTTNGLPGGEGGKRRPLAMLSCHDLDDHVRVARHLVEDLQVPVILGPMFSGITISTATDVTVPAGVLTISPSATSAVITDLADNGLVWRTAPSDAIQAIPLAMLVEEAEKSLRVELSLKDSDQIRVAIAVKSDAYGQGLAVTLQELLKYNGKSAVDNGANFKRENYEDPSEKPTFDFSPLLQSLVAFKPHIIIPLGTNESITRVLAGVESAWPTTGSIPPRPRYLFPDGGKVDDLLEEVLKRADLRTRVMGTAPGRKGANYDSFKIRYRGQFGEDPGVYSDKAYDAGYLVAYALAGFADEVTGTKISAGLGKVSAGSKITVGPTELNKGFNLMTTGAGMDFDGASGALNFDASTGEAPADIDQWCLVIDQNTNKPVFISSGRYFDASTRTLTGEPSACQ